MPNAWVEFVKEFARKNNTTYGCALSNPKCKEQYQYRRPQKLNKKEQRETEMMGEEEKVSRRVPREYIHEKLEEAMPTEFERKNIYVKKIFRKKIIPDEVDVWQGLIDREDFLYSFNSTQMSKTDWNKCIKQLNTDGYINLIEVRLSGPINSKTKGMPTKYDVLNILDLDKGSPIPVVQLDTSNIFRGTKSDHPKPNTHSVLTKDQVFNLIPKKYKSSIEAELNKHFQ